MTVVGIGIGSWRLQSCFLQSEDTVVPNRLLIFSGEQQWGFLIQG